MEIRNLFKKGVYVAPIPGTKEQWEARYCMGITAVLLSLWRYGPVTGLHNLRAITRKG